MPQAWAAARVESAFTDARRWLVAAHAASRCMHCTHPLPLPLIHACMGRPTWADTAWEDLNAELLPRRLKVVAVQAGAAAQRACKPVAVCEPVRQRQGREKVSEASLRVQVMVAGQGRWGMRSRCASCARSSSPPSLPCGACTTYVYCGTSAAHPDMVYTWHAPTVVSWRLEEEDCRPGYLCFMCVCVCVAVGGGGACASMPEVYTHPMVCLPQMACMGAHSQCCAETAAANRRGAAGVEGASTSSCLCACKRRAQQCWPKTPAHIPRLGPHSHNHPCQGACRPPLAHGSFSTPPSHLQLAL